MRGIAPRGRSYGPKPRTVAERTTEMTLFLYGCTDKRLAETTVGELVARHRLAERECEYALIVARGKRA